MPAHQRSLQVDPFLAAEGLVLPTGPHQAQLRLPGVALAGLQQPTAQRVLCQIRQKAQVLQQQELEGPQARLQLLRGIRCRGFDSRVRGPLHQGPSGHRQGLQGIVVVIEEFGLRGAARHKLHQQLVEVVRAQQRR